MLKGKHIWLSFFNQEEQRSIKNLFVTNSLLVMYNIVHFLAHPVKYIPLEAM